MAAPQLTRPDDSTRTAEQVLDIHAQLTTRYRYPPWHISEFMLEHIANSFETYGDTAAVGHMFWPVLKVRRGAVQDTAGQDVAKMIGADLLFSETIQVTAHMLHAMYDSAPNTTPPGRMEVEEVPFPAAFAWLDTPWRLPDTGDGYYLIRAISWRRIDVTTDHGMWPAVRIVFWAWLPDEVVSLERHVLNWVDVTRRLGEMLLIHTSIVPLASDFEVPGDDGQRESANAALVMLRLLWTWLGMEIADTARHPVHRSAVKRAARHLRNPAIRVIKLRKVRHATDAEGTHRDVDWACQWPVRGHHRHIEPYDHALHRHHEAQPDMNGPDRRCLVCGAKTTWVRPYVKGPDGKPLRVSKTIYKLAR